MRGASKTLAQGPQSSGVLVTAFPRASGILKGQHSTKNRLQAPQVATEELGSEDSCVPRSAALEMSFVVPTWLQCQARLYFLRSLI